MQIQFTGHSNVVTTALKDYANKKVERIQRFAKIISTLHIIFTVDKARQVAEAQVNLHGTAIHASAESEDMYKTIDLLVDKLIRQLNKHKEKHVEHR